MRAYGKALMALLQQGWDGPHGVSGRFQFQGSYLGAQSNCLFEADGYAAAQLQR
jgi:hypothetical protein